MKTKQTKNVKKIQLFLVMFMSFGVTAWAIKLPSQSYLISNELYEKGKDNVTTSYGTTFYNLNMKLEADNSAWGTDCTAKYNGQQAPCQTCCADWLRDADIQGNKDMYYAMYKTCMQMCDGGPSLPLDMPVWFIAPMLAAYAFVRRNRIRNEK